MSFTALVETDTGDSIHVRHIDGSLGGNALVTFMPALSSYCSGTRVADEIRQWFDNLQQKERESICILARAYYSGDWEYGEDEYERFRRESPEMSLTQDEFRKTVQQVAQKYVDSELLLARVKRLTDSLEAATVERTWWYDPEWTLIDFQALARTLSFAMDRGAKRVRIRFR